MLHMTGLIQAALQRQVGGWVGGWVGGQTLTEFGLHALTAGKRVCVRVGGRVGERAMPRCKPLMCRLRKPREHTTRPRLQLCNHASASVQPPTHRAAQSRPWPQRTAHTEAHQTQYFGIIGMGMRKPESRFQNPKKKEHSTLASGTDGVRLTAAIPRVVKYLRGRQGR